MNFFKNPDIFKKFMYSVCRIKKNFTYYTTYKFSIYLVTLISHRHYPTVM